MTRWLVFMAVLLTGATGCEYLDVQSVPFVGAVRLNPIYGPLTVRTAVGENEIPEAGRFDTAVYTATDLQNAELLLVDGPADAATRVMHIRMFWKSAAGRTPFDPSATNAAVRYITFTGDDVTIYGGGGLMSPRGTMGEGNLSVLLENATLRMMDASSGVDVDASEPIVAEGTFSARLDQQQMRELRHKIQQRVNEKLGYSRVVWEAPSSTEPFGG